MTEDKMFRWHHQLNGHEFEQALWSGEGQGSVECHSPWGRKELDMAEWLDSNSNKPVKPVFPPTVSWVLLFFFIFIYLFVVNFVIHWNEKALGSHVFPISWVLKDVFPKWLVSVFKKNNNTKTFWIMLLLFCSPANCHTSEITHNILGKLLRFANHQTSSDYNSRSWSASSVGWSECTLASIWI